MPSTISTMSPPSETASEWNAEQPSRNARYGVALNRVRNYVKTNPKKTLFTVTALGLVVAGLIAKRRR